MPQHNSQSPRLILASGSPYRRQMLERLGLAFEVLVSGVDETPRPDETGVQLATRLAREKTLSVASEHAERIVIGCDQVAECDGRLLGKPGSIKAAIEQLMYCRGKAMVFHSAIAVAGNGRIESRVVPTRIRLRNLDQSAIRAYVERDRPLDCAGAMRSESLGIGIAESISSDDPTALIGLPLIATVELLDEFGLQLFRDY